MVALFATMTFALTSCGDDDDEPSGVKEQILQIDGVTYYYYGDAILFKPYFDSDWNSDNDGKSGSINLDYYTRKYDFTEHIEDYLEMSWFNYSTTEKPCEGMDLAKKRLISLAYLSNDIRGI